VTEKNIDMKTVQSFGDEWTVYDQSSLSDKESRQIFDSYFAVFPWSALPREAEGFDMGCGSGRWARLVAPRVGRLHCIDPSRALEIAKVNLAGHSNVEYHLAGVDDVALPIGSQDFGYSLGVLHHIPDTAAGIKSCASLLKSGAPLLLYLYYAFDNKPTWFRVLWKISDAARQLICRLPPALKRGVTNVIAATVYYPLARLSRLLEVTGFDIINFPLSAYREASFYTMRTDALDRFGTPLENRFTRREIERMMNDAGLEKVCFSDSVPYWCAVGWKR
jgi:SAM-dependent methyltransferase